MGIVEHLENYVDTLTCGCWAFYAPLHYAGLNEIVPPKGKECCYSLIVTNYTEECERDNYNLPFAKNYNVTFYAVINTSLGVNVFNERPDHPISESLYVSIIKPISECLGCGSGLCGLGLKVNRWIVKPVINLEDYNWTGVKVTAEIREIL